MLCFILGTVKGVQVERIYVGTFMTSLEMAGFSLTLLHLNDERKKYLGESQCRAVQHSAVLYVQYTVPGAVCSL